MKVHYVEVDKTYLIANHAVAKNLIFRSPYFKNRIRSKVGQYLSAVCTIHKISIHDNQFQILVRLKSREEFINYYREQKDDENLSVEEIPESTYIFSQIMANFQASIAIHFNRTTKRTGAVFARRFSKILVEGVSKFRYWMDRLKRKERLHYYNTPWYTGFEGEGKFRSKAGILDVADSRLQGQSTKQDISIKFTRPTNPKPPPKA